MKTQIVCACGSMYARAYVCTEGRAKIKVSVILKNVTHLLRDRAYY